MRTRNILLALTFLSSTVPACSKDGDSMTPPRTDAGMMMMPDYECPESTALTVCQLKLDGNPAQPALDQPVIIDNLVVTSPTYVVSAATSTGGMDLLGFYVQDRVTTDALAGGYSGILVNFRAGGTILAPQLGDVVHIEGTFTAFGAMTGPKQKQISAGFVMSSGTAPVNAIEIADPATVATGGVDATRYEGVLIKVSNVSAAVVRDVPGVGTNKIFGAFQLAGGLVVKNDMYDYPAAMSEQFLSISGILKIGTRTFDSGISELLPRSPEDVAATNPPIRSIVQLQDPNAAGHPAVCQNMGTAPTGCPKIEFNDVLVTASHGFVSTNFRGFWVQDTTVADGRFAGVLVTYGADLTTYVPEVGDRVRVTGEAVEYFRAMQIQRARFEKVGTGAATPVVIAGSAITRTDAPESNPYEGVLVRVENVTVTQACVDSSNRDFGYFEVSGPILVGSVFIYDYIGTYVMNGSCADHARMNDMRTLNDHFSSITGVVDYAFNELRLQPRSNADLVR